MLVRCPAGNSRSWEAISSCVARGLFEHATLGTSEMETGSMLLAVKSFRQPNQAAAEPHWIKDAHEHGLPSQLHEGLGSHSSPMPFK